jgi:hypothetical protein
MKAMGRRIRRTRNNGEAGSTEAREASGLNQPDDSARTEGSFDMIRGFMRDRQSRRAGASVVPDSISSIRNVYRKEVAGRHMWKQNACHR